MHEDAKVRILTMLLGDDGKPVGNLGLLLFPPIPQIGSHVLLYPPEQDPNPRGADPEYAYRVVNVVTLFARPEGPNGERRCDGWEIEVEHLGRHLDDPRDH